MEKRKKMIIESDKDESPVKLIEYHTDNAYLEAIAM